MLILYVLLALILLGFFALLTVDILVVLLSYGIYWYEYANKTTAAFTAYDQRFTRTNLILSLHLIVTEIWFNFITLLFLPLGIADEQTPEIPRGQTPVILLNGLFANRSCWFWFKRRLRRQGITNIISINLSSWHNEEVLTELLSKRIDEIRHRSGVNRVHLVGHSMGAIIARNYVQCRGGQSKTDKLICLGAPHHGSKLAFFSFVPLGKILIPGSSFLQRLNSCSIPQQVKITNIYSLKDNMVIPPSNCSLDGANSIALDRMGHTSLLYRNSVVTATAEALRKE